MSEAVHRILPWATRYALGRYTYSVDDVVNTIVEVAPEMSVGERKRLLDEIGGAIREGVPLGAKWRRAAEALEAATNDASGRSDSEAQSTQDSELFRGSVDPKETT